MKVIQNQNDKIVLRFDLGESFPNPEFLQFLEQEKINGAHFSGLGGASKVRMGFLNHHTKTYGWKIFENMGMLEVVAISGEISIKSTGERAVHTHLTISDESCSAFGGHLDALTVGATLEIFLTKTAPLHRAMDEQIGIEVLQ